jgi:hypothetical protein
MHHVFVAVVHESRDVGMNLVVELLVTRESAVGVQIGGAASCRPA